MNTNREQYESTPEKSPLGKVMGVVKNRQQLDAISYALNQAGAIDFEIIEGAAGLLTMNSEEHAVAECFLGDMESKMVHRYQTAIEQGNIVFAAIVEPHLAEQAAEMSKTQGAVDVVYFGNWVITNY